VTLLIAYLLFYNFGYGWGWYVFAYLLWVFHVGAVSK
jgi:hypothetical protein